MRAMKNPGWSICIALVVSLIGMVSSNCSRAEPSVESRFRDFMVAWQAKDFHTVWELLSPQFKAENVNETHFTSYVKKQNFRPLGFTIQSVKVEGRRATIIAEVKGGTLSSSKITVVEREMCQLTLQQGLWYYDGCKPAR